MLDKLALVVLLMTIAVCEESSILANIEYLYGGDLDLTQSVGKNALALFDGNFKTYIHSTNLTHNSFAYKLNSRYVMRSFFVANSAE